MDYLYSQYNLWMAWNGIITKQMEPHAIPNVPTDEQMFRQLIFPPFAWLWITNLSKAMRLHVRGTAVHVHIYCNLCSMRKPMSHNLLNACAHPEKPPANSSQVICTSSPFRSDLLSGEQITPDPWTVVCSKSPFSLAWKRTNFSCWEATCCHWLDVIRTLKFTSRSWTHWRSG